MALRTYEFSFKGLCLGGKAIVLAPSFDEAKKMVKAIQPFDDEPLCANEKGDVVTKPSTIHFDNGDY